MEASHLTLETNGPERCLLCFCPLYGLELWIVVVITENVA